MLLKAVRTIDAENGSLHLENDSTMSDNLWELKSNELISMNIKVQNHAVNIIDYQNLYDRHTVSQNKKSKLTNFSSERKTKSKRVTEPIKCSHPFCIMTDKDNYLLGVSCKSCSNSYLQEENSLKRMVSWILCWFITG